MPVPSEATFIPDEAACDVASGILFAAHEAVMPEATNAVAVSDFGGMLSIYTRKDTCANDIMRLTYRIYDLWRERVVQEGLRPEDLPETIAGMVQFDLKRYLASVA